MRLLSSRLPLLAQPGPFRPLFVAQGISELGTWLAYIALTINIYALTGSGAWVSALLLLDVLPAILIGITLAPLLDRFNKRRTLIGSDLVNAAVFLTLPFAPGPEALLVLACVSGFANGFFKPTLAAALPGLVAEERLPMANALQQTVANAAMMVGPIVAALVVAGFSVDAAYGLNAVSFVLSALFISRLPTGAEQREEERHWEAVRAGLRLYREPLLAAVLVSWPFATLAVAGINVGEILLAKSVLQAGDSGFGLLASASGAGLVVGGIAAGPLLARSSPFVIYRLSLVLSALGIVVAAVAVNLPQAMLGVAFGAAGNAAAIVCLRLVLQKTAPAALLGRAFSLLSAVASTALVIGMASAGVVADLVGVRALWGAAALASLVAALAATLLASSAPQPLAAKKPETL